MKRVLFVAILAGMLVACFSAANAQCTNYRDYALMSQPIGLYVFDSIAPSTSQTYGMQVTAGHSYTFTIVEYYQVGTGSGSFDLSITGAYANSTCSTPLTTTSASAVDPTLTANNPGGTNGARVSFVAPSTGTVMFTILNSDPNNTNAIYMAAADTTMISPRWSTYSGYYTSYGFTNTSSVSISGTLKFITTSGTVAATTPLTIPAGTNVFMDTTTAGVATSQAGEAIFTHNGAVGSILADGYMQNITTTPWTVIPVKFETVTRVY